jgi:hypothetical protein
VAVLQYVESTFEPLPSDQYAARLYGQICAAARIGQPKKPEPSRALGGSSAAGQFRAG